MIPYKKVSSSLSSTTSPVPTSPSILLVFFSVYLYSNRWFYRKHIYIILHKSYLNIKGIIVYLSFYNLPFFHLRLFGNVTMLVQKTLSIVLPDLTPLTVNGRLI